MSYPLPERAPPQDLAAEQATLGAMLMEREAILRVRDILTPEDFYSPQHGMLYRRILDLFTANQAVDVVTLQSTLQDHDQLEEVGGLSYLADLQMGTPTAAMVARYAGVVKEKSTRRRLRALGADIMARADRDELAALCEDAATKLYGISSAGQDDFEPLPDVLARVLDQLEEQVDSDRRVVGIPTGIAGLDRTISGWQVGTYNVIAARPGIGKTAFALEQSIRAAEGGKRVAFFSLEMTAESLGRRYIAHGIEEELRKVTGGWIARDRWDDIVTICAKTADWQFWLCKRADLRASELRAQARMLAGRVGGLDLIVVDYMQLVTADVSGSRNEEMTQISQMLKAMSLELNCGLLALSQLNRAAERERRPPRLSDLRDSGSIEQDADLVLFIHYPTWDDRFTDGEERPRKRRLEIAKHRNGPVGWCDVSWTEEFQRFQNLHEATETEEDRHWMRE